MKYNVIIKCHYPHLRHQNQSQERAGKVCPYVKSSQVQLQVIPSMAKQLRMCPLRFNLRYSQAFDSFRGVKFSVTNIFVLLQKLCFLQSILPRMFLLGKNYSQLFLFKNSTFIFFGFCLPALSNLWQTSMTWCSTYTSISVTTDITDLSMYHPKGSLEYHLE